MEQGAAGTLGRDGAPGPGMFEEAFLRFPAAAVLASPEGAVLAANRAAQALFGWTAGEIRDGACILPPELADAARAVLEEDGEVGEVGFRGCLVVCRRDGTRVPAELSIEALATARGRCASIVLGDLTASRLLERVVGAAAAIAELATAAPQDLEAVLHETAARMQALVDADMAAVALGGGNGGPFDLWSTTGVEPEIAARIGRPPRSVGVLGAVIDTGLVVCLDDIRGHPAFVGLPAYHPQLGPVMAIPLAAGGRRIGAAVLARHPGRPSFTDPELHALEVLATHAALWIDGARLHGRALQALRGRDEVLAVVAHDLRNPLHTVRLYSQSLMRNRAGLEPQVRGRLEGILRAVARMDGLVQDLIDVARTEAGRLPLRRERVGPEAVLAEAVEMLRPMAAAVGVDLALAVEPGLPNIAIDRRRISQVIANLVDNAVKFSPPGSTVHLSAGRSGSYVCFCVRDKGPGITPEQAAHVFDRFWQAETAQARRGAGLGLTIARNVVELHGGSIWIESELGVGTAVFFLLPQTGRVGP